MRSVTLENDAPEASMRIAFALGAILAVLIAAHGVVVWLEYSQGVSRYSAGMARWHMDAERNIPASYSTCLILSCAFMLAALGGRSRAGVLVRSGWFVFAAVFVFLALDEFYQIHENIGWRVIGHDDDLNFLGVNWLSLYAFVSLPIAPILLIWFFRLPLHLKVRFVIAGAVFLSGAAGMEILAHGSGGDGLFPNPIVHGPSLASDTAAGIEEALEIAGMSFFALTLWTHIATQREMPVPAER